VGEAHYENYDCPPIIDGVVVSYAEPSPLPHSLVMVAIPAAPCRAGSAPQGQ
jgi:hypothetical protein